MTWARSPTLPQPATRSPATPPTTSDLPLIDPTEAQREICYDRDNLLDRGYQVDRLRLSLRRLQPGGQVDGAELRLQLGAHDRRLCASRTRPGRSRLPIHITIECRHRRHDVDGDARTRSTRRATTAAVGCRSSSTTSATAATSTSSRCRTSTSSSTGCRDSRKRRRGQDDAAGTRRCVQPAVRVPVFRPPPNGTNALRNSSLEQDSNGDAIPDCWSTSTVSATTTSIWTRTSDAHSGSWAEKLDVTNYINGDNKLLVLGDLGYCTPSVNSGHRYRITEWYKSNAPVYFTLFSRDSQWQVRFLESSPSFPASSTWTQASYVTDVIPTGINGISVRA